MSKNDTSEILLVGQPGNDKLCRIRTLLDAVSMVKFTYYGAVSLQKNDSIKGQTYVQVVFPRQNRQHLELTLWEGAIAQNGCVHDVQIYTGKHGGSERCSSGTRSDKQIERKILHVYMDLFFFFFFFFFFRVLLCLKAFVVVGFTVFALYVEVGKGCHRL